MFKKLGVFALMLFSAGTALLPATAFAQERYGYNGSSRVYEMHHRYVRNRDCDRYARRDWAERQRLERHDFERRAERRDWR